MMTKVASRGKWIVVVISNLMGSPGPFLGLLVSHSSMVFFGSSLTNASTLVYPSPACLLQEASS
jgi:hypothetical protein